MPNLFTKLQNKFKIMNEDIDCIAKYIFSELIKYNSGLLNMFP